MKITSIYLSGLFCTLLPFCTSAQNNPFWDVPTGKQVDSLKKVLAGSKNDTVNMYLNRQIGMHYQELDRPVALASYKNMLTLAEKTDQRLWKAEAFSRVGYVSCLMQDYSGGLRLFLLAQTIASEPSAEKGMWKPGLLSKKNDPHVVRLTVMADIQQHLGLVHYFTGDFSKALGYHQQVKVINENLNDDALMATHYLNIGESHSALDQPDSAEFAFNKSLYFCDRSGFKKYKGLTLYDIGKIYQGRNNYDEAKKYYRLSIETNIEEESPDFEGMGYQVLADMAQDAGNIDSMFFFSRKALNTYMVINDTLGLIAAYSSLSSAFDATQQKDSAYYYLKKGILLKDALNKEGRIKVFQLAGFNEQFRLQELEAEQLRIKARIRTYSFISGIIVLLLVTGLFYRNYRRQKKDRVTIERSYTELKATQAQLIQSEKMASLGELTAGIAHEIQNPLNFVNNFSEVNNDLIDELKSELTTGNVQLVNEIADNIKDNGEKISHHGKRADAIVKGMLLHSRTSRGQKEPTDINALCDEYLRLAYHGLRARDKSFNAKFDTDFDNSIGNLNIVPQDIGRVILNLINNAFYAVDEKKKQQPYGYEPTVSVSTKNVNGKAEIAVKDNGNGIPKKVVDKIFHPFFTTKPTGQGTGLGLSLAYDIVKAHGGELIVETKEGEGTTFFVILSN